MIYVYHDFGGTHTTSLAAAYHLNIVSNPEKVLDKKEILNIPYFNKLSKHDAGKFIFHGIDQDGHAVYTLGKRSSKLVLPSLSNFSEILTERNQLNERIIFSNTSPVVPFAMTVGGFLSRGLKLDAVGVPLLIMGTKQCCLHISKLVEQTKEIAKKTTEQQVITIDNHKFQA
ncbi:DUF3189 family protein [Metabacillus halosaccharovorans]|uniref:DUF3189 family protein n=1 Tax=Metabacillus halosaccharovorans TaxID=930124 RepID=UPI001C1F6E3F|nr:DUF3189 family protein [Metabacillus halosaccharovorans]MBU7592874.1 DUF3189 family protein [Metabacillus halosaccharovorans]